jgi:hypothetical protein
MILGAFRSKIMCETNIRRRLQKSVQKKNPNSALIIGFFTMTIPQRMMHEEFASSWLRNPIQK